MTFNFVCRKPLKLVRRYYCKGLFCCSGNFDNQRQEDAAFATIDGDNFAWRRSCEEHSGVLFVGEERLAKNDLITLGDQQSRFHVLVIAAEQGNVRNWQRFSDLHLWSAAHRQIEPFLNLDHGRAFRLVVESHDILESCYPACKEFNA